MMLRFRKMMAVLLAAALTLTMLTACGGGGSGASVDAKVKLTESVNEALKKDGYTKVLKYDAELDDAASTYHINDVGSINADWKKKKLDREMFRVDVLEAEKANSASKIAEKIGPALKKGDDWRIGYYIKPIENNRQEVVVREFTIILEWKEVTK